ncbi:MAG: mandelate racemase/muconate lactonizing enzyme family protein [Paracoccaceae bacterium]|nr:mandelate racemase/muconate lactonizing enzyme family protein [Paracoccaceae bacterium]
MVSTINDIRAIPVGLPFQQHEGPPAGFGGKVWQTLDILLVRVETSDGIVGWGDAFGYNALSSTKAAVDDLVAPLGVGQDARDIAGVMDRLSRTLHLFGRSGPVQYALSGLDIALWDIAGKRAGLPVAQLLGGAGRTAVPSYASLFRIADNDLVARVCEGLAEDCFSAIKLHEIDPHATLAARQGAGPDIDLMMDVNCPWDLVTAREAAAIMAPADLKWLEEPIWPPEDFAALSALAASGIPLAAGENVANAEEMTRLASAPGVSYVQPSVTKIGGITAFHRAAQAAKLAGRRVAPHSPYFGPGLLATLQLAAVHTDIEYIEMFGATLTTPLFDGFGLPGPDKRFAIPTGPGLGADPEPDVINRFLLG